ncbi:NDxxF motif lipoprotein [Lysinibacillus sp. Y5S-8]|uniref:NDxxF motif lipoprotein n=1 Tax=Lysinibacillus sp. Y5S-8 TaxID=3122488 RepID=UPI0030CFAF59
MMRRILFSCFILFILSACSQEENIDTTEDEVLLTQNVEIPSKIFTSEKENSVIDEEEIKVSIKTYLDSHEELDKASYPFQEMMDEEKELNKNELEKLAKITNLTKENDENFSKYILNNTLPEGYQKEAERISQYITAYNEIFYELDEILSNFTEDVNKGVFSKINIESIINKSDVVNGREQKKIEEFLDKKNIDTKAFGRKHNIK